MKPTHVMLDHPAWNVADDGTACRATRTPTGIWLAAAGVGEDVDSAGGVAFELVEGAGAPPVVDVVDPDQLRTGSTGPYRSALHTAVDVLRSAGPVARLRNPDLWDALATSIVRQVIRAGHARTLYRRLCDEHGQRFTTDLGTASVFPSPETVLALDDDEYARLGLKFKRDALRAAAEAYLRCGWTWSELAPDKLGTEVQSVRRIGPWTAGATVADVTNDYRHYPFADLAVRTWAERLMPEANWPTAEPEFAAVWREATHEQLSDWTLLTLAWGVRHARGVAI